MAGNRRGLHAYTVQEGQSAALGQAGSIHVRGTGVVTAPTGSVFVAIQFLEDTVFASDGDGLSAQDDGFFPDSQNNSPSISSNGTLRGYNGASLDINNGITMDSSNVQSAAVNHNGTGTFSTAGYGAIIDQGGNTANYVAFSAEL